MYKDYRFINAGENEFYRWGKKALEKDDNQKTFDYHNWDCKKINIYQAGMYGIIIQFEGVIFS